ISANTLEAALHTFIHTTLTPTHLPFFRQILHTEPIRKRQGKHSAQPTVLHIDELLAQIIFHTEPLTVEHIPNIKHHTPFTCQHILAHRHVQTCHRFHSTLNPFSRRTIKTTSL